MSARLVPKVQLVTAISHLRSCRFSQAASIAEEALADSSAAPLRISLLNCRGVALHLLGKPGEANDYLATAVNEALSAASSGIGGDDSYLDIGGALGDLAANYLNLNELDEADKALKRGEYMLKRAYRPSPSAHACLLSVRGCLHDARGDVEAAFGAHQEAYAMLLRGGGASDEADDPSWLQACRHGSWWALLRSGESSLAAAEALALADLDEERLAPLNARDRAFARSRHAIAAVQRLRDTYGETHSETHSMNEIPEHRLHVGVLESVVHALSECLGEDHYETDIAKANHLSAKHGLDARSGESNGAWTQHWLLAVGGGLRIGKGV